MQQLCVLLCLALLCQQVPAFRWHLFPEKESEEPLETTPAPQARDFAFDLYRVLVETESGKNIFFSPLSISVSLGALSLGASSNTKREILEALGAGGQEGWEEQLHTNFQKLLQDLLQPRDNLQLNLGNGLFLDSRVPVLGPFLSALRTHYLVDTFPANFSDLEAAKRQINTYVEKETGGQITELVKDLQPLTAMVLVNYILFKAKWETRFNPQDTTQRDFHVTPETVVQVPMMQLENQFDYFLDRSLGCKVVRVPYKGGAHALLVLPNQGGLEHVESRLTRRTLQKWQKMFRKRPINLSLPKFSIDGSYELHNVLPKLGVKEVFTSQANLSSITGRSNIFLSEMVHKAVGEVDESGTKAAAVTGMMFMFKSARMSSFRVEFNRPFIMAIMYNSTEILFLGRVYKP